MLFLKVQFDEMGLLGEGVPRVDVVGLEVLVEAFWVDLNEYALTKARGKGLQ